MAKNSEVLIVSGMSGAGRSTTAHALEDMGWYVVDNLPPTLIDALIKLLQPTINKIAIIIPCHRIIKTGGAIGAYGWGVEKKLWLLRHEGALD